MITWKLVLLFLVVSACVLGAGVFWAEVPYNCWPQSILSAGEPDYQAVITRCFPSRFVEPASLKVPNGQLPAAWSRAESSHRRWIVLLALFLWADSLLVFAWWPRRKCSPGNCAGPN